MKNLFKSSKFYGILSYVFILATFGISLGLLFISFKDQVSIDTYNAYNSSFDVTKVMDVKSIFSFIVKYFTLAISLPVALNIIGLFKRNNAFHYISIVFLLILNVFSLIYNIFIDVFTLLSIILIIVNILLTVISFILVIFRKHALIEEEKIMVNELNPTVVLKKHTLGILFVLIIAILALFSIFFVPVYTIVNESIIDLHLIYLVLFNDRIDILDTSLFIGILLVNLYALFTLINLVSYYFSDKINFVIKAKRFIYMSLSISLLFFLGGFGISFYYILYGVKSSTLSFIPLVIISILTIIFSILKGKFDYNNNLIDKEERTSTYPKIEPLIYVLISACLVASTLFLSVIRIYDPKGITNSNIAFTGLELLKNYATLTSGYQIMAFYVVSMYLTTGLGLLVLFSSYFSRYKYFIRVAKTTLYLNVLMVFLLGISGLYFSIAREINLANLQAIFELYGLTFDEQYVYKITTDVIYVLLAGIILIGVAIVRKTLNNEDSYFIEAIDNGYNSTLKNENDKDITEDKNNIDVSSNNGSNSNSNAHPLEELPVINDPCKAFSSLDDKVKEYEEDLEKRNKSLSTSNSLHNLISFVVDYAKNSRLHLSYSKEDIATFISGLGASRLSILQGMSGTGKTSLPKIFLEAIMGKCYIIEVESSWKDKNELLGYYNEFSMYYTPKKFTTALYESVLNKDIPTFIVLDEMNLSRIEYYFSDFLSLMENEEDKRELKLLNVNIFKIIDGEKKDYLALKDGTTLKIPSNVWFIGTANRDESTFVISDKVYDRAHTMNFNKRAKKVNEATTPIDPVFYDYNKLNSLLSEAIEKGDFDCENNELIKKVEQILAPYNISFGNRILNQIEKFVNIYKACFPRKDCENEAIETILLSKVVAKLEVKTIPDKEELLVKFKDLNLLKCVEFIEALDED